MRAPGKQTVAVNGVLGAGAFAYGTFEYAVWPTAEGGLGERMLTSTVDTLGSPSFVSFVLVTAWSAYCAVDVRSSHRLPRLLRLGSYAALLRDVGLRALVRLIVPAFVVVVAGSLAPLVATGGSADASWQRPTVALLGIGLTPPLALIIEGSLIVAFLIILRVLVEAVTLIGGFSAALVLLIGVWIWGVASASGFIAVPSVDARYYVILQALVSYPTVMASVAVSYIVTIAVLGSVAWILDRASRDALPTPARWVVPSASAFLVILLATLVQGTSTTDVRTHLEMTFLGPGGTVFQMLVYLVLLVGYAYVVQLRVTQEMGPWSRLALVRHGSRQRFARAILRAELPAAGVYCVSIVVSALLSYVVLGGRDLSVLADPSSAALVFQITVTQYLQIAFYVVSGIAVILVSRSPLSGLIFVGIVTCLAAVPIPADVLVPVQRSAAAIAVLGGWAGVLTSAVVLVAGTAVVSTAAVYHDRIRATLHLRDTATEGITS